MAVAWPSVLAIDRSVWTAMVSTSVAELLPGAGSVAPLGAATDPVLLRLPVAAALSVPVNV